MGEVTTGVIEASSHEAAIELLQSNELIVISCAATVSIPFWMRELEFLQRVKQKEIVTFSRQLAILFSAKVGLVSALEALAGQQENPRFRNVLLQIASDTEAGVVLSKSLAKHPDLFSSFFTNLIKAGEVSGNLENTLNYLADHLEKQYYLTSKVRGAMIYPAFILVGFIVVAVLMLIMVIPNLVAVLKESGQELPWATKLIIFLSDGLRKWGWLALIVLVGAGIALWRYIRTPLGRRMLDRLKLEMPILGPVFQKLYLARFTENLSTLIKGGLPVLQALQIAGEVVDNVVFAEIIFDAKEQVRIGNTISSVLEKHEEIPSMVVQMIVVGERSGHVDFVMKKVADYYLQEVDAVINNLSSLIEPFLIILLGIGVAVLLVAVLLPIYNIAGGM